MSEALDVSSPCRPAEDRIRAVLEDALGGDIATHGGIRAIERKPSAYRTSFELDELVLTWEDGTATDLMFKNLSRGALLDVASRAKPAFLYDPVREIETYRSILGPVAIASPRLAATLVVPEEDTYWLFLERAPGVELYQIGSLEVWRKVARQLARLHARFLGDARLGSWQRQAHLLRHDRAWYHTWLDRAEAIQEGELGPIRSCYRAVVEELVAMPVTFVHGELVASNVMVEVHAGGTRVTPLDWEMAAVAPPLTDLAALIAGTWDEETKMSFADAYYREVSHGLTRVDFRRALDCCRLALAVQWLGWSEDWNPPAEHRYDWLAEAHTIVHRLTRDRV